MYAAVEYLPEQALFHVSVPRIMGTVMELVTVGSPEGTSRELWEEFSSQIEKLDERLNRFSPDSEVSKVNSLKAAPTPFLEALLYECDGYRDLTDGLFDVHRPFGLDFGGFAKGYALDKLKELLESAEVPSAFVDFGRSSMLAIGRHPFGDCWKVALRNPYSGGLLEELELRNESLSTSGNMPGYEGHIVNPKTGKAAAGRRIAVVRSPNPLDAEVLSTVLMISDKAAVELLEKNFPNVKMKIYNL